MLYNDTQTIAAISTAVTESGIGIVRISGEQAIEIADRIYRRSQPTGRKYFWFQVHLQWV